MSSSSRAAPLPEIGIAGLPCGGLGFLRLPLSRSPGLNRLPKLRKRHPQRSPLSALRPFFALRSSPGRLNFARANGCNGLLPLFCRSLPPGFGRLAFALRRSPPLRSFRRRGIDIGRYDVHRGRRWYLNLAQRRRKLNVSLLKSITASLKHIEHFE